MSTERTRQSNFELLRIIAMLFIVYYHLIIYFVQPVEKISNSFFSAIQLTLHTGVLLFVLISGYFGIKPSIRGGIKLLLMTFVYYVPTQVLYDYSQGSPVGNIINDFLFISHSPYWFIRTYLMFYVFVPIVNKFLESSSNKAQVRVLVALAIINFWFGCIASGDNSLIDGKNIVNFTFLYIAGHFIRDYSPIWQKMKLRLLVAIYLSINIFLICGRILLDNNIGEKILTRLSFGYNSPLLLLNAMALFLCIGKIKFSSKRVNRISASMFAVYLITEQPVIREKVIDNLFNTYLSDIGSTWGLSLGMLAMTIALITVCVLIDNIFRPLWNTTKLLSN